ARPPRQPAAAMVGPSGRPAAPRSLQRRRPCQRLGAAIARRGIVEDPLPRRLHARRPRIAPAPGVFLCLGVAAGHLAPPDAVLWRSAVIARPCRDPAQRHTSEHRDRRADAAPDRYPPPALGRRLARYRRHLLLPEPHALAGGARDLAGRALRAAVAAPSRHPLPRQFRAPRRAR